MSIFHIHINSFDILPDTTHSLLELGYMESPLYPSLSSSQWAAPPLHLSYKNQCSKAFKDRFSLTVKILKEDPVFFGFIEGEMVYKSEIIIPVLTRKGAELPNFLSFSPYRKWREAEIHITIPHNRVPSWFHDQMTNLGFGCISTRKNSCNMSVYSLQGDNKPVELLYELMVGYLSKTKEWDRCYIKLEKSVNHWISPGFYNFPDQLRNIELKRNVR